MRLVPADPVRRITATAGSGRWLAHDQTSWLSPPLNRRPCSPGRACKSGASRLKSGRGSAENPLSLRCPPATRPGWHLSNFSSLACGRPAVFRSTRFCVQRACQAETALSQNLHANGGPVALRWQGRRSSGDEQPRFTGRPAATTPPLSPQPQPEPMPEDRAGGAERSRCTRSPSSDGGDGFGD